MSTPRATREGAHRLKSCFAFFSAVKEEMYRDTHARGFGIMGSHEIINANHKEIKMSENSKIEWTEHTFNPWWGCAKVSPACDNCYAERDAARFTPDKTFWGINAERREFGEKHWNEPKRWNAAAMKTGVRARVFCASMADVFDKNAPAGARERLWELIKDTPHLDWLLLTKRVGNAAKMVPTAWIHGEWPSNAWLGVSVVNQEEAERDIPKMLDLPAKVRFLSIEPMLGPINLPGMVFYGSQSSGGIVPLRAKGYAQIDWVIAGGESGPNARPAHPDWFRSLRDQCLAAEVPFLFKQWGEWGTAAVNTSTGQPVFREFPDFQTWVNKARSWVNGGICLDKDGIELKNGRDFMRARDTGKFPVTIMHRVGKRTAGRLLDGVEWNGVVHAETMTEA